MNFGLRDLAYMVVAASLGIGVYFDRPPPSGPGYMLVH